MLELRLVRCTGLESKKIQAGRPQHRIVNTILGHSLYLCSKLGQDPLEQVFTYLNRSKCSSLYCGLSQVRLQPLNGVLWAAARMIGGVPIGLAILQTTCGMYPTGFQFSSASTIGSHLLSGIVFLVTRLF